MIKIEEVVLFLGYRTNSFGKNMENNIPYYQKLFDDELLTSLKGIDNYVLIDASDYKRDSYNLNSDRDLMNKAQAVKKIIYASLLNSDYMKNSSIVVKTKKTK